MPALFWYFPFIVFSGAFDVILSQHERMRPNLQSERDREDLSAEARSASE